MASAFASLVITATAATCCAATAVQPNVLMTSAIVANSTVQVSGASSAKSAVAQVRVKTARVEAAARLRPKPACVTWAGTARAVIWPIALANLTAMVEASAKVCLMKPQPASIVMTPGSVLVAIFDACMVKPMPTTPFVFAILATRVQPATSSAMMLALVSATVCAIVAPMQHLQAPVSMVNDVKSKVAQASIRLIARAMAPAILLRKFARAMKVGKAEVVNGQIALDNPIAMAEVPVFLELPMCLRVWAAVSVASRDGWAKPARFHVSMATSDRWILAFVFAMSVTRATPARRNALATVIVSMIALARHPAIVELLVRAGGVICARFVAAPVSAHHAVGMVTATLPANSVPAMVAGRELLAIFQTVLESQTVWAVENVQIPLTHLFALTAREAGWALAATCPASMVYKILPTVDCADVYQLLAMMGPIATANALNMAFAKAPHASATKVGGALCVTRRAVQEPEAAAVVMARAMRSYSCASATKAGPAKAAMCQIVRVRRIAMAVVAVLPVWIHPSASTAPKVGWVRLVSCPVSTATRCQ